MKEIQTTVKLVTAHIFLKVIITIINIKDWTL